MSRIEEENGTLQVPVGSASEVSDVSDDDVLQSQELQRALRIFNTPQTFVSALERTECRIQEIVQIILDNKAQKKSKDQNDEMAGNEADSGAEDESEYRADGGSGNTAGDRADYESRGTLESTLLGKSTGTLKARPKAKLKDKLDKSIMYQQVMKMLAEVTTALRADRELIIEHYEPIYNEASKIPKKNAKITKLRRDLMVAQKKLELVQDRNNKMDLERQDAEAEIKALYRDKSDLETATRVQEQNIRNLMNTRNFYREQYERVEEAHKFLTRQVQQLEEQNSDYEQQINDAADFLESALAATDDLSMQLLQRTVEVMDLRNMNDASERHRSMTTSDEAKTKDSSRAQPLQNLATHFMDSSVTDRSTMIPQMFRNSNPLPDRIPSWNDVRIVEDNNTVRSDNRVGQSLQCSTPMPALEQDSNEGITSVNQDRLPDGSRHPSFVSFPKSKSTTLIDRQRSSEKSRRNAIVVALDQVNSDVTPLNHVQDPSESATSAGRVEHDSSNAPSFDLVGDHQGTMQSENATEHAMLNENGSLSQNSSAERTSQSRNRSPPPSTRASLDQRTAVPSPQQLESTQDNNHAGNTIGASESVHETASAESDCRGTMNVPRQNDTGEAISSSRLSSDLSKDDQINNINAEIVSSSDDVGDDSSRVSQSSYGTASSQSSHNGSSSLGQLNGVTVPGINDRHPPSKPTPLSIPENAPHEEAEDDTSTINTADTDASINTQLSRALDSYQKHGAIDLTSRSRHNLSNEDIPPSAQSSMFPSIDIDGLVGFISGAAQRDVDGSSLGLNNDSNNRNPSEDQQPMQVKSLHGSDHGSEAVRDPTAFVSTNLNRSSSSINTEGLPVRRLSSGTANLNTELAQASSQSLALQSLDDTFRDAIDSSTQDEDQSSVSQPPTRLAQSTDEDHNRKQPDPAARHELQRIQFLGVDATANFKRSIILLLADERDTDSASASDTARNRGIERSSIMRRMSGVVHNGQSIVLRTERLPITAQIELEAWGERHLFFTRSSDYEATPDHSIIQTPSQSPYENAPFSFMLTVLAVVNILIRTFTNVFSKVSMHQACAIGTSTLLTWCNFLQRLFQLLYPTLMLSLLSSALDKIRLELLPRLTESIPFALLLHTCISICRLPLTIAKMLRCNRLSAMQWLHLVTAGIFIYATYSLNVVQSEWYTANSSDMREKILAWREECWDLRLLQYLRWCLQLAIERQFYGAKNPLST